MTSAAILDRRRPHERLALWADEAPVIVSEPAPAPQAPPDAVAVEHGAERLGDAVDGAWSALESGFAATCLVCGGAMRPRWSAGAGVVGGRCSDCGTDLE